MSDDPLGNRTHVPLGARERHAVLFNFAPPIHKWTGSNLDAHSSSFNPTMVVYRFSAF